MSCCSKLSLECLTWRKQRIRPISLQETFQLIIETCMFDNLLILTVSRLLSIHTAIIYIFHAVTHSESSSGSDMS